MVISKFQMGEVCTLPQGFIPSSKGIYSLSLYIILPNLIKIGQELFEIIDINTYTQTDRHTDRHIHADENNTCPKTKFLGQVINNLRTGSSEENAVCAGLESIFDFESQAFTLFQFFLVVELTNPWFINFHFHNPH